jgi:hypothetical protein
LVFAKKKKYCFFPGYTFFLATIEVSSVLCSAPSSQGLDEMLGNVSLKALIIAYHAVPGSIYDAAVGHAVHRLNPVDPPECPGVQTPSQVRT